MNITIKQIISWLLVIIWAIVIFMFSGMESDLSNNKSESAINTVVETTLETTNNLGITNKHPSNAKLNEFVLKLNSPLRKCMHAFVYFILALLILNALNKSNVYNYKLYIICFIICFLYSLLDEYHQTFIVGRTGQIIDSLIDTSGSIFGMILYYFLFKYVKNRKIRQS